MRLVDLVALTPIPRRASSPFMANDRSSTKRRRRARPSARRAGAPGPVGSRRAPAAVPLLLDALRCPRLQFFCFGAVPVQHVTLERFLEGDVRHLSAQIEPRLAAQLVQAARFLNELSRQTGLDL